MRNGQGRADEFPQKKKWEAVKIIWLLLTVLNNWFRCWHCDLARPLPSRSGMLFTSSNKTLGRYLGRVILTPPPQIPACGEDVCDVPELIEGYVTYMDAGKMSPPTLGIRCWNDKLIFNLDDVYHSSGQRDSSTEHWRTEDAYWHSDFPAAHCCMWLSAFSLLDDCFQCLPNLFTQLVLKAGSDLIIRIESKWFCCYLFHKISNFTCGAAEATGLGFVCFVVINPWAFLFHIFFNFTLPPPPQLNEMYKNYFKFEFYTKTIVSDGWLFWGTPLICQGFMADRNLLFWLP